LLSGEAEEAGLWRIANKGRRDKMDWDEMAGDEQHAQLSRMEGVIQLEGLKDKKSHWSCARGRRNLFRKWKVEQLFGRSLRTLWPQSESFPCWGEEPIAVTFIPTDSANWGIADMGNRREQNLDMSRSRLDWGTDEKEKHIENQGDQELFFFKKDKRKLTRLITHDGFLWVHRQRNLNGGEESSKP
jgi:hypothetical protein